ncbi:FlgO family outer membrane protein [Myxococcus qinghaiensis]|uniref:FlgO family outer membrane protein n=1 Tax=Myxococcus qinghaiensis TaxID=2906758 RepID=UPI0020A7493B|nr:FlgO family outer membrane protein [Myxococcus qinghaiensis]MCP3162120.1 hypothetical protein [Myxococcus qinghaiensis]
MTAPRWLLLFLACSHVALAAEPTKPPPGPAAVMPFRNLNTDTSLDWLARGMTETLISDLRASGRIQLVEREQLDAALAELDLQERQQSTESTAVRVGRLVGARTVVLGSIQRAEQQVRINARFIDVETGVVLDTAKVTGPVDRIFALQDQVASRLLGSPVKPRVKRPSGREAVLALETYGRALAAPTEDERAWLLRATLAGSPGFEYAREELSRLEKRLAEHALRATPAREAADAELRATMQDPKRPSEERASAALRLLDANYARGRWRTLVRDTERVLPLGLPLYQLRLPAETALWFRFIAFGKLEQWEAERDAGDTFLRTYPQSVLAEAVDAMMRASALVRASEERALKDLRERLAKEALHAAQRIADLERQGKPTDTVRRELDYHRCFAPSTSHLHHQALLACRAYYELWGNGASAIEKHHTRGARESEIFALVRLRRHAEARERLAAYRAADPEGEQASFAREQVLSIRPSDEE